MKLNKFFAIVAALALVVALAHWGSVAVYADQTEETLAPANEETVALTIEETAGATEEVVEPTEETAVETTGKLMEQILACTDIEELWTILDELSEAECADLTGDEVAQINSKLESLEPAPVAAVVIEESEDQIVASQIEAPTVNYTNVAPIGAPVNGN